MGMVEKRKRCLMLIDWTSIKHFKREEWVKDPDKISPDVVWLLDAMREDIGKPIIIHIAWDDDGHVNDSSHYTMARELALAVDFHISDMSLLDQWLFAERYPWNSIGLYPYWENPGLHCDLRRLGRDHPHLGKRWWRDKDNQYMALDKELVKFLMEGTWTS
jgi:hypothetical protein